LRACDASHSQRRIRPGSVLVPSGCQKRTVLPSAATSSSRVAMLIHPVSAPADDARWGANQMRQRVRPREHLRRGNAQIASWTGANSLVFGLGDQACSVFGQEQRLSHEALGRLLHGCHVDRLRRTAFLQRRTRVAGSLAFSLCRCKRNETPGQRTESVAKPAVQAQVPSRCRCRSELDIHRAHAADVALPSKSTARRCVSLTTGSPRRAGPPYGLPAQADTLRRVD
jgi:hypothetical protein